MNNEFVDIVNDLCIYFNENDISFITDGLNQDENTWYSLKSQTFTGEDIEFDNTVSMYLYSQDYDKVTGYQKDIVQLLVTGLKDGLVKNKCQEIINKMHKFQGELTQNANYNIHICYAVAGINFVSVSLDGKFVYNVNLEFEYKRRDDFFGNSK